MPYTPTSVDLERWVSSDRMRTYQGEADPVACYLWNIQLSAAYFEMINHVEVLLRNAIHLPASEYAATNGGVIPWFDDPHYRLQWKAVQELKQVRKRLDVTASEGKVVADLSFGFWRFLLTRHYQATLWPRVQRSFTGLPTHNRSPAQIGLVAGRINKFRNRVAHHEPIFGGNLATYFDDLVDLATAIDPDAAQWVRETSRVPALISSRP